MLAKARSSRGRRYASHCRGANPVRNCRQQLFAVRIAESIVGETLLLLGFEALGVNERGRLSKLKRQTAQISMEELLMHRFNVGEKNGLDQLVAP